MENPDFQKEKALTAPLKVIELLKSITSILGRFKGLSTHRMTQHIVKALSDFFGCENVLLLLSTDRGENLEESTALADKAHRTRDAIMPLSKQRFPNLTANRKRVVRPEELLPSAGDLEEKLFRCLAAKENTFIIPLHVGMSVRGCFILQGYEHSHSASDLSIDSLAATVNSLLIHCILLHKRKQKDSSELELSRALADFSPHGVFVLKPGKNNMDFTIVSANKAALTSHGYKKEELTQRSFSLLQDPLIWMETLGRLNSIPDGKIKTFECRQKCRNGDPFLAELSIQRIWLREEILILLSCREAAKRTAVKRDMPGYETKYALSAYASNDGHWLWDMRTNVVYYSPRWSGMLGYETREIRGDFGYWDDLIHSEDLPKFRTALARHLQDETEFFEVEYRARHSNGNWHWMLCHGSTLRSAEHRILHVAGTQVDITQRKLTEISLRHDATHDPLTKLPNRLLFTERLFDSLQEKKEPFAVFCIDIDRFKPIKDTYGEEGCLALLKEIGLRLSRHIQSGDTLARTGGDEFSIISKATNSVSAALELACSIQDAIALSFVIGTSKIYPTVSIGFTLSDPEQIQTGEALFRDAETAMYRAKAAGGACNVLFETNMHEQVISTLQMEEDLKKATDNSEFELFFQPLFCSKTQSIRGFEALSRWHHPTRGIVSPSEFLPTAEKTGVILEIGKWVLGRACSQLAEWRTMGYPDICMAVNFSARQFEDEALPRLVEAAIRAWSIPPHLLEVEITETVAMKDHVRSMALIAALSDIGVRVSIDDFGTGYSSLKYLKHFCVNALKIDQSFIREIPRDHKNIAIVNAIIALANSLQLEVTAEGVETCEQFMFLEKAGCHNLQGYILSKPVAMAEATRLLREGIQIPQAGQEVR
jgi:diguanylate cyclase (GGDEF)-like protein/PAS domain S-box-containing protein